MAVDFEKFFYPKSVVVVGASGVPHKPGNDVVRNILANGYEGKLYLVNPKGEEILGMKACPSIQDLPEGIDLAVVVLPAGLNPQAIRDCAAKGIKAIVLAAGGFSEVDEKGEELQENLTRAVRETGVRVIGPNTSGHTSTPHNFTSTFFPQGKIPPGARFLHRPDRELCHPHHAVHYHRGELRSGPGGRPGKQGGHRRERRPGILPK
jgi:acyl-CoA synthetase (NDP forming)